MADIWKEYILFAVGAGITLAMVFVLSGNFNVVRSAATNESNYEQLSAVNPLSSADVSSTEGSEVIATIRYYYNYPEVTVNVNHGGIVNSYTTTTYDSSSFLINTSATYSTSITYDKLAIVQVTFTLQ